MSTKAFAGIIPSFVPKKSQLSYLRQFRDESFSREPLQSLINAMKHTVPRAAIFDEKTFPLITSTYNWIAIKEAAGQIIEACDSEIPATKLTDMLVQTWTLLPGYLLRYQKFYQNIQGVKYPNLTFMHNILVTPSQFPNAEQIQRARKLEDGFFLSLDNGIITKNPSSSFYTFNRLMSKSQIRVRAAVDLLNQTIWNKIDLDGIVKEIRDNTGTRYYNLTTDSMVNTRTAKRMVNVNSQYRIVADASDTYLFNHVIGLLDHEKMLKSPKDTIEFSDGLVFEIHDPELESSSEEDSEDDLSPESPLRQEKKHSRRVSIPSKVRQLTWRQYIGSSMDGECWCCGDDITFENWHAGHVLAYTHGGKNTVHNLRPLCASCNLSMHDVHMADFIRDHEMKGRGAEEFCTTFPSTSTPSEDIFEITDHLSRLNIK